MAPPWIGPGRTSATWTVRSSRSRGRVRGSICICARLSIWKTPVVSAARIDSKVSSSSSGIRERSSRSPRARPISSTQRSTAESIPSPSRSILRKPASAQESLSHWTICRPSIAAGTTGQTSISGRVEITIPPGCWEEWRGRPIDLAGRARAAPASAARRRARAPIAATTSRSISAAALVEADRLRHPLDLRRRQPQRLAEVAHRAARAVGREGGDEGGAVGAVALVHARDQHLADVAREVEVDVRHRGRFPR